MTCILRHLVDNNYKRERVRVTALEYTKTVLATAQLAVAACQAANQPAPDITYLAYPALPPKVVQRTDINRPDFAKQAQHDRNRQKLGLTRPQVFYALPKASQFDKSWSDHAPNAP